MLFRLLILGLVGCILFFLGQGFYQIFVRKANMDFPIITDQQGASEASLKTVKLLAIRVGLSFTLLIMIILAKRFMAKPF